jgi:hypothetical protein
MCLAPSEARKQAVAAMSAGCPSRPSWVAPIRVALRRSVSLPRKKSVSAM